MPYCENCGTPLSPDAKFCGKCGTSVRGTQNPPPPPPPTPLSQTSNPLNPTPSEQTLSFIIAQLMKRFGTSDYYTGVLTTQRLIFVAMTKNNLKEVTEISRQQAKGKISPGQIIYPYQQSLLSTPPSVIIANNPSCLVIENNSITEISLAIVGAIGDGYSETNEYELKIKSLQGNYTFRLTKRGEYVARLRQVYQDKLRLL